MGFSPCHGSGRDHGSLRPALPDPANQHFCVQEYTISIKASFSRMGFPISDRQMFLLCQATGWKEINILSMWREQDLRRLFEMGAQCLKAAATVTLPGYSSLYETPGLAPASNFRNLHLHATTAVIALEMDYHTQISHSTKYSH